MIHLLTRLPVPICIYITRPYENQLIWFVLDMLDHPIILITDGQRAGVEDRLLSDPIIGPKVMILSDKDSLDGADVALAVLADVFIGNPASVTSGYIARSRMALGYSDKSTQLFRTLDRE